MAISFALRIAKKINPKKLLSHVSELSGLPYAYKNELFDERSGLVISAYNMSKEGAEFAKKDFGFYPNTYLSFRHGKFDYYNNNRIMMMVVVGLLKGLDGDFALEYTENPNAVLIRINGVVTVDTEWIETPGMEFLEKAGITYKLERLYME